MNLGIRLHDMAGDTLEKRALAAKNAGFTCVHLALSKVLGPACMEPAMATPGLAVSLTKALQGLDVAVLGCYLNLADPDETEYRHSLEKYIAHLNLCRWMNAGCVGTETGNGNADCRYDPALSHTQEALEMFIRRLRPVVEAAEKLGATLAIEPVYTHIVSDPRRARYVLDAFRSPCLQIILDPVNLLHPDNLDRRDAVIDEALTLLGDATAVMHLKDYVLQNGELTAVAAGLGLMDYSALLAFVARRKPQLRLTLENTTPGNAEAARAHIARLYQLASSAG